MGGDKLVLFNVRSLRVGIVTGCVEQVVAACEVIPLPNAPAVVRGMVDVHGVMSPVFDANMRFGRDAREVRPTDSFIICNTSRRKVVLLVESVIGVEDFPAGAFIGSDEILPDLPYVDGVVRIADNVVLVQDLNRFLSLDEQRALDDAMEQQSHC